jgi:hypothetical protein
MVVRPIKSSWFLLFILPGNIILRHASDAHNNHGGGGEGRPPGTIFDPIWIPYLSLF